MSIYKDSALAYWEAGFKPIPIDLKTKAAKVKGWAKFSNEKMTHDELDFFINKYGECGIGLVMGNLIGTEGYRVIAVDVDDEDLVQKIEFAIGRYPVAKRGKKGTTIFVKAAHDFSVGSKKLRRLGPDGKKLPKPSVEILGIGTQTVIPPTIHPETQLPYTWTTERGLLDVEFLALPEITEDTFKEFELICAGKDKHFDELNTMTWLGEGGGGNTHDVCTEAVAHMVATGWTEDNIHKRINSAKEAACRRNGDVYSWPEAQSKIQEWIDSARKKGYGNKDDEGKPVKTAAERQAAIWLLDFLGGHDNVVRDGGGVLRRYTDGHWPALDTTTLEQTAYREFPGLTNKECKAAVSILHVLAYKPNFGKSIGMEPREDPRKQKMCLMNGTLNLLNGEFGRHDPEDEIIHQMNFDWDENSQCPIFDKFIEETFRDDPEKRECVLQFMGYSLIPDNSFQKMLVLIGDGGNGKGALTRLWSDLMDPNAVATVALNELEQERKLTSLYGKLVNLSSEQNRFNALADNALKRITGEDAVTIRRLYQEPINNVKLTCRMVLQVNEMPSTNDSSGALKRRLMMIEFINKPEKPDPYLNNKLYKERAGIIRKYLLPSIQTLYAQGHFTIPKASDELVAEYLRENDPVHMWMESCCDPDKDGEGSLSSELFAHFSEWASRQKYRYPVSSVSWGKGLKAKGYPPINKWIAAQKTTFKYRGLKLKPGEVRF